MFDPAAFANERTKSVGIAKQSCCRLCEFENCQVGTFVGCITRKENAIVNSQIYLNEDWAKNRARHKQAGIPKPTKFQTRHPLALEMLAERGERCHKRALPVTMKPAAPAIFPRNCCSWPTLTVRGSAAEHNGPRHRCGTTDLLRTWTTEQVPICASG